MVTISSTVNFHLNEDTVVAIGKFDGIHKGHLEIIKKMLEYKKNEGLKTAILTFDTPPSEIIDGKAHDHARHTKVLTTLVEKRRLFQEFNIDYLIEFPFNEETAQISAEQFIKQVLMERMRMCAVVVGSDCRFGKRGQGNAKTLMEYGAQFGYDTEVIDKVVCGETEISSSYIRSLVENGNIEGANKLLMRPFMFYGEVVHGRELGRSLGMPTVNLIPQEDKLLPPSGVYYSRVNHMGQEYRSITNIGCKPTVAGDVSEPVMGVETYIYNFDEDVYGDNVYVSLYKYVRSEMKFDSVEDLKKQMEKDIMLGMEWHREHL